jgi:hypothetical protein
MTNALRPHLRKPGKASVTAKNPKLRPYMVYDQCDCGHFKSLHNGEGCMRPGCTCNVLASLEAT